MGCVYTHWRIPTIERCGSLNRVWSIVEKDGEDNQKAWKAGWTINQATNLGARWIVQK
jgi:hypothetical protein